MKKYLISFVVLVAIFLISIWQYNSKAPNVEFYYWQQQYDVPIKTFIKPHYIKCIDIGFDKDMEFRATKFVTSPDSQITPVVYIDNDAMLSANPNELALKIVKTLDKLSKDNNFNYNTIQVDCDWTLASKDAYFSLLKSIKNISKKSTEATIRLHQIKFYKKTGVPPVDRGILMYYNMSDFYSLETKNYILDLDIAKQYHYGFDTYPLPLDLALPLYSQARVIRFSKVIGAIEGVDIKDIDKYFKPIGKDTYIITQTHYFKEKLLYKGDTVRFDNVEFADLVKATKKLSKIMNKPKNVIFYHFSSKWNKEELDKIVEVF
jgi:hypothetical protein